MILSHIDLEESMCMQFKISNVPVDGSALLDTRASTVKPVSNDHLSNKIYYLWLWFIQ